MFYNKKGQFYLIISIVLAAALFGITYKSNTIDEAILFEDFEDLTNNYIKESEYVINKALEKQENVETNLNDFTKDYLVYSKQVNPDLNLLYVNSNGTNIILVNHFNTRVNITNGTVSGSAQELVQDISVRIAGKDFSYKIPVKAENFGYNWYSSNLPSSFGLSVAGFLHNFDMSGNGPEFKVLINLPQSNKEFIYPGSKEYDFRASPDLNIIRQVKLRK